MSYFANHMENPYDEVSTETFTCSCGCKLLVKIYEKPGFNEHETYNCPNCNKEYSAHCDHVSVSIVED